jgi:hypothetical protein
MRIELCEHFVVVRSMLKNNARRMCPVLSELVRGSHRCPFVHSHKSLFAPHSARRPSSPTDARQCRDHLSCSPCRSLTRTPFTCPLSYSGTYRVSRCRLVNRSPANQLFSHSFVSFECSCSMRNTSCDKDKMHDINLSVLIMSSSPSKRSPSCLIR